MLSLSITMVSMSVFFNNYDTASTIFAYGFSGPRGAPDLSYVSWIFHGLEIGCIIERM